MSLDNIIIARATLADLEGILALERANRYVAGGTLSSQLTAEEVATTIREIPSIVARRQGRIVGFLLVWEKATFPPPSVVAMLQVYPGAPDAYVYGPICVYESVRGRGVAAAMFAELRRLVPDREGILFISESNVSSLRAHGKLPMVRKVGEFNYVGATFNIFAYPPLRARAASAGSQ